MKIRFEPGFLDQKIAGDLFRELMQTTVVNWQQENFKIFGRETKVPRQTAWFGEDGLNYRYTGLDHQCDGWPNALRALHHDINQVCGQTFNFVMLNRYESGADYMGWHRDAEAGTTPTIASLSLGQSRKFRIQNPADSEIYNFELGHGSLLVFDGYWRHQLPSSKRMLSSRINLTFRNITS